MKLENLCKIKHGYAFNGKHIVKDYSTKYILVTPGNFNIGGGFKSEKCKYFSESGEIPKDYILHEDDLIITMTDLSVKSDTLGYSALVPYDQNHIYLQNQRIGLVYDIDESKVLRKYLYWFMRTKKYHQKVVSSQSGTAIHHTSPNRILDIDIELPPIDVQRKIIKVLEDIDNKIKLNNQINDNLEEQLKNIFYNNFFKDIINNSLENYDLKTLEDVLTVIDNRGKTPPLVEYSDYPIIDVKALSGNGRIIDYCNCQKFVSLDVYNNFFRSGHPQKEDILISTVGSLAELKIFYESKGTIAQNVVALRSKTKYPMYIYQYLKAIKKDLVSYNIGSVQPSIKVTQFMKHSIYISNYERLMDFENIAKIFTKKIYNNEKENQTLKQLRDMLLPKLMNGEIDLENVEI